MNRIAKMGCADKVKYLSDKFSKAARSVGRIMSKQRVFYVYAYMDPSGPASSIVIDDIQYDFPATPIYIGKGHGDRCLVHFKHVVNNPAPEQGRKFYNTLRKFMRQGKEVTYAILESGVTEAEAFAFEHLLIKHIGREDLSNGPLLNLTSGGEGVAGLSAATREKIGAAHRGKVISQYQIDKLVLRCKGQKLTDEHRRKIGAAGIGRAVSSEARARISAAQTGRMVSEETRRKLSLARLGVARGSYSESHRKAVSVGRFNGASSLGERRRNSLVDDFNAGISVSVLSEKYGISEGAVRSNLRFMRVLPDYIDPVKASAEARAERARVANAMYLSEYRKLQHRMKSESLNAIHHDTGIRYAILQSVRDNTFTAYVYSDKTGRPVNINEKSS